MQHFAIVADHIAGHFQCHILAILAEGPAALAAIAAKRETIVLPEIIQRSRHSVSFQIGR